jgi:organic hydroperoxide reductase OsmC/OhrA
VAIDAALILQGPLGGEQLDKLRAAAETCRISRALNVPVSLRLTLT